jgi:hypothetical protein
MHQIVSATEGEGGILPTVRLPCNNILPLGNVHDVDEHDAKIARVQ